MEDFKLIKKLIFIFNFFLLLNQNIFFFNIRLNVDDEMVIYLKNHRHEREPPTCQRVASQIEYLKLLEGKKQGGIQGPLSQLKVSDETERKSDNSVCFVITCDILPSAAITNLPSPRRKGCAIWVIDGSFKLQKTNFFFFQAP